MIPVPNDGLETLDELGSADGFGLMDELPNDPAASGRTLPPLTQAARNAGRRTPVASPTKRRQRAVSIELPGWAVRLVLPLIVGGFVLLSLGYREWRLASLSNATPQQMTLADLAANGPGDNIHIELSDFCLLPELSVVKMNGENVDTSRWTYVWIPAVPIGGAGLPGNDDVKVIIGANRIPNVRKLEEFCRRPTLRGLVVNETDGLDSEERKLLNEGLQGVDAASCYFFRSGQGPVNGVIQAFLLLGGAVLLLAGLGIGAVLLRARFA